MDDVLPRGTWAAFDVEAFRLSGGWSAGVRETALDTGAPAALPAGSSSAGAPA